MNKCVLLVRMGDETLFGFIAEDEKAEDYFVHLHSYQTGEVWRENDSSLHARVSISYLLQCPRCTVIVSYPLPCNVTKLKLSLISLLSEEADSCVSVPCDENKGQKLLRRTLEMACESDITQLESVMLKGDSKSYHGLVALGGLLSTSMNGHIIPWNEITEMYNSLSQAYCLPSLKSPTYDSHASVSLGSGTEGAVGAVGTFRVALQGNDFNTLSVEEIKALVVQVTAACKFDPRYLVVLQELLYKTRDDVTTMG